MLRAMDSAVAGLRAHQNKMDVVGHNIANVNTFGFKAQTYTFKEAMYQTSTSSTGGSTTAAGTNAAQYGYGALMGTIGVDMTASTPTYVGGFNASISGDGFFIMKKTKTEIELENTADSAAADAAKIKGGDFLFGRVGQFTLDSNGYVVDGDKNFVYGYKPKEDDNTEVDTSALVPLRMPIDFQKATTAGGKDTIEFDNMDATKAAELSKGVEINSAGEITVKLQYTNAAGEADTAVVSLGKLAIATFQNPNGLNKAGSNYYTTKDGDNSGIVSATVPGGATPDLMTGYVEASNVDLAKEFADMITTHRGFQSNTKMITVSDEMLSDLVAMKR